ncbi:MAG: hypothetical protein KIH62_002755 [Candidatus Kerfeldbacteria bacterium]|nr:hypothetical protein [Candidatus Kerfeldbacteria bacterium]
MWQPTRFDFSAYTIREDGRTVDFVYALDEKKIVETLTFHTKNPITPSPLIDRFLFNLHLILGVSYYKVFCPHDIIVSSGALTAQQAKFWNSVYTKGLGQFFFENRIDFRDLIHFPATEKEVPKPVEVPRTGRALVPLGGGKDSLVTCALLKKRGIAFDVFMFGSHATLAPQIAELGASEINVTRTIDNQLLRWNEEGALNGHIPISAIFSWVALLCAAVDGYQYVLLSNENSANVPNVDYLDMSVNHQWSKSFEYEKMLQEYVRNFITDDITYCSVLRPFTEVTITELFVKHCGEYFSLFTSCNKNFSITKKATKRWCGECPKCAFVFTLMSAFVSKKQLVEIFGKNLFADEKLLDLYRELFGVKNFKPFECVGTPDEVIFAFEKAHTTGEFNDDAVMKMYIAEIAPRAPHMTEFEKRVYTRAQHLIPEELQYIFL